MARLFIVANLLVAFFAFTALAQELERDIIETSTGDLKITFIGHGTLMFYRWKGYPYRSMEQVGRLFQNAES